MTNWDDIRQEWEQSGISFKALADKYGLKDVTIRSRKNRENWQRNDATQRKRNVATSATTLKPSQEPEIENNDLTDKQRLFILEYMRDFNATRAAMAVGYSKKTAYSIGWELLRKPEIQAEIKRMKDQVAGELGLDIKRIIAEYMKIAFTDITDLLEFGQREVPVMTMFGPMYEGEGENKKPVTKIVNFIDFKESFDIDGTVISEVKQGKDGVSIKLHDKMRALKELEKYTDFMTKEQRLKVDKLQIELDKLQADNETDEVEDDGFIAALSDQAAEVWSDGDDSPQD